jgi:hypothetical protein
LFMSLEMNAQVDPDFLWVKNIGGPDYEKANDVAVDGDGNIIVPGSFQGTLTIGTTTLNSFGLDDIFITKLDPEGNFLWAVKAGGSDYDEGIAVTTDVNNNIIVTGSFSVDAFFGSNVLTSSGGTDVFTAKYAPDGSVIWARKGGGNSFDASNAVAVDNNGNIYITGIFTRSITFDPFSIQGGEYFSIFLVKYDSNGNAMWLNSGISNGFYNSGNGIATNSLNDVFLTGMFGDQINFSGTILTSVAGPDVFLVRYDTNGNLIWIRQAGGTSYNEAGYDIAIAPNNDIFLTGGFSETINFGGIPPLTSNSFSNSFVAKYNLSGTPQWAVITGTATNTFGGSLDLDNAGNIVVLSTTGQLGLKRGELDRVHFAKLRNDGNLIWEFEAGGEFTNTIGGIAVNNNGEAYAAGGFDGAGTFGSYFLNNNGLSDVFIGKLPSPQVNLITPDINFESVEVGNNANRTVSISNPSSTTLNIYNFSLSGPNANEFSITGSPENIAPQQTANLNVTFTPLSLGQKNAVIVIESEAVTTPDTVYLSGVGGNLSLTLSSNLLDFGTLDVNNSAELFLTLSNTGTQSIIINDIQISGSNQNEFGLIGQLQDTIPASESRNVRVIYTPSSPGSKFAELSIISNAPSSPDIVSLIGNAISSIIVDHPEITPLGQTTNLTVTPPEGFNVVTNIFHYKRTGESEFQQSVMAISGENYIASIPSAFSTVRGIQYYIEFSDGEQTITFPSENPVSNPAALQVNIERLSFPETIPASIYRMVSAPMMLDNPSLSAVLTDDYGPYDTLTWKLFNWNPQTQEYIEFPNLTKNFSPGNAFWIIHRTGELFDFENGESIPSSNNINVLIEPGWNQIANPFAFPIDWSIIDKPTEVQPPVRWLPDSLDYEYNQLVLEPWEGYWVYNGLSQSANLSFPPIESSGDAIPGKLSEYLTGTDFYLQIKSSIENSMYRDNQNFIGMFSENSYALNSNLLEVPPITNDIRLSIIDDNSKYAQKILAHNVEGGSWDIVLSTTHKNQNVNFYFNEIKSKPELFNLWLLDLDKQVSVQIVNNTAVINPGNSERMSFQLIIGTEDFAKQKAGNISLLPLDYALYQNYPNPFNPSTTIEYNLRERSVVTLDIFDVLGRKVAAIFDSDLQNSGKHSVSWDGRNLLGNYVSSGVYIYQLRANDFVLSKKMVLVR